MFKVCHVFKIVYLMFVIDEMVAYLEENFNVLIS